MLSAALQDIVCGFPAEEAPAAEPASVQLPESARRGPPRVVHVARTAAVTAVREGLPILGMEQEVMEAVSASDVVLLCGETGCGKTTQVGY